MDKKLDHNPNWHGGRFWHKHKRCYMLLVGGKYVREHRYLVEQHVGGKLPSRYDVIWLNKDRRDNRLENLIIVYHAESRQKH